MESHARKPSAGLLRVTDPCMTDESLRQAHLVQNVHVLHLSLKVC